MQVAYYTSGVFWLSVMFRCFGFFKKIKKLVMLATFASILDFFQSRFKDIISRVSRADVLVHFFHKSSCAISIPLDVLHKFCKMAFYFVDFLLSFTISIMCFFCYCIVTFVDLHDFVLEKDT